MLIHVFDDRDDAVLRAADIVAETLLRPEVRNVMLAGGNTPLPLYAEVARRALPLERITIFVLDEYVGVPGDDPRTCANLIRRAAVEAWGVDRGRFCELPTRAQDAAAGIERHEHLIRESGGLDLVILGLGQNGHIGFNEPGSAPGSPGRVLALEPTSVEANRAWFGGEHAPDHGVTTGLKTILAARKVILLAFGEAKAAAVSAMTLGPPGAERPASWLQLHPDAEVFLDRQAAAQLPSHVGGEEAARREEDGASEDGESGEAPT